MTRWCFIRRRRPNPIGIHLRAWGWQPIACLYQCGSGSHVLTAEARNNALTFTPHSLLGRTTPPRAAPMPTAKKEDDHNTRHKRLQPDRLQPPRLDATGACVTGANTPRHRIENKRWRKALLATQSPSTQWTTYKWEFELPPPLAKLESHRGEMCPAGLALHHPAAELLKGHRLYYLISLLLWRQTIRCHG